MNEFFFELILTTRLVFFAFLTVTVKPEVLEIRGWSHCFSETISFDLKKKFVEIESGKH